ncbi:MAG: hypothetical protein AABY22_13790, partial [Nanoarchaeota archaeon]
PGASLLSSQEFSEYCKEITKKKECEYFENFKDKNLRHNCINQLKEPHAIGNVDWNNEDVVKIFDEFMALYPDRPFQSNTGGMKIPHLLPMYFFLKRTQPKVIIESGVFMGQGTWLFKKASPNSKIISIEIYPEKIKWRNPDGIYMDKDFSEYRWNDINQEDTLLFFDDHIDAVERLKWIKENTNFKKIIFEDNYAIPEGSPSLKYAFDSKREIAFLTQNIKTYYEFPPIYVSEFTRWNTPWINYSTAKPLFNELPVENTILYNEMKDYTWICYVELK